MIYFLGQPGKNLETESQAKILLLDYWINNMGMENGVILVLAAITIN